MKNDKAVLALLPLARQDFEARLASAKKRARDATQRHQIPPGRSSLYDIASFVSLHLSSQPATVWALLTRVFCTA